MVISNAFWFQTFFFGYYCLWGYPFMTFTKSGQQMTFPLPPSAKISNRSIVSNNGICKHVTNFKNPPPLPFCVDIINVCFLSGFLKFDLSHVWMQMTFWILWKFSQVIFCQAIKETKQAYISNYISYFLNNFLVSLCQ